MTEKLICKGIIPMLLFLCLPNHLGATSHYLVKNKDGLWLVSDTLVGDYGPNPGDEPKLSHDCKVGLKKGSITFATGYFREVAPLLDELNTLPMADLDSDDMGRSVSLALSRYGLIKPGTDRNTAYWQGGIASVQNETFNAEFFRLSVAHGSEHKVPRISTLGVPDGFGVLTQKYQDAANADAKYRDKINKNPKEELIKMLEEEAKANPTLIGPPYSVFLLHPDGTISDYSQGKDSDFTGGKKCQVPVDARYKKPKQQKPQKHN